MKKKNYLKSILTLSTCAIMTFSIPMMVYAAPTKAELQNEQNDIDAKIKQTESEIKEVKQEMSATMQEIQKLTAQISEYETQIEELEGKIAELETAIEEAKVKIKQAEEKYNSQKESLQNRLIMIYENGTTSYLDVLLTSKSLTDFISNYYLVSEITAYDTELLESIEAQRKEIEMAKESLETSQKEVEAAKESKEKTTNSLRSSKSVKDNYVGELSADEKELQAQLEQFEKDKREIQAQLAALAAKEGNYEVLAPSKYGYISPIPGKSKANITCGFYGYAGHTGADFGSGVTGKTVVAVKSGTVVTSTALKNSNGTYRSYGEYVVINHHDGTMTLYAHMLAGSRKVVPNQKVSQGQAIGTVGSTGNSTGTHLHFEVRVNGKCVNPAPYLP